MKAALFKEVSYPLPKLMEDIDKGIICLPDRHRPFVWKKSQVRDLLDSMYKGYPVGYLLFWPNGGGNGHKQICPEAKPKAPQLLVVDGRQRLASLYAVVHGGLVCRSESLYGPIWIAFRPRDEKFEVADAAVREDPEFIANISVMWLKYTGSDSFVAAYMQKLRASRQLSPEEEKSIPVALERLWDVKNYTFSALELSPNASEEQVAQVFVRINSAGVTHTQSDFLMTLMSVFWDEGRHEIERFCREARIPAPCGGSPFDYFIRPDPNELLRVSVGLGFRRARLQHVYSILRGKDLETGEFSEDRRTQQFEVLKGAQSEVLELHNWYHFLATLLAAGYRNADMITSRVGLIYSYVMYLLGRRHYKLYSRDLPKSIARWFFMTSLTGRYSNSPESQLEADLLKLQTVRGPEEFRQVLDQIILQALTDDFWNIGLPNSLATSTARSPSLYAYYAALNLLGARALFSKLIVYDLLDPALKAIKNATERHHLFPKNYLKKLGITERSDINQIANFAVLAWTDNINISDRCPNEYFPEYEQRCVEDGDSDELTNMRFWHALPDGWEKLNYQEFLMARRKLMAKVIRAGFEKLLKGVDLPAERLMAWTFITDSESTGVGMKPDNPYEAGGMRARLFDMLSDGEWHSTGAMQTQFRGSVPPQIEKMKQRGAKTELWRIEQDGDRVRMSWPI